MYTMISFFGGNVHSTAPHQQIASRIYDKLGLTSEKSGKDISVEQRRERKGKEREREREKNSSICVRVRGK